MCRHLGQRGQRGGWQWGTDAWQQQLQGRARDREGSRGGPWQWGTAAWQQQLQGRARDREGSRGGGHGSGGPRPGSSSCRGELETGRAVCRDLREPGRDIQNIPLENTDTGEEIFDLQ